MQIFHTYNIDLMKNNQLWAVLLVILLVAAEWGAKCETEKIAFEA
jgi:hypothetical protein